MNLAKAFGIIGQFDSTGNNLAIDIFKTISSIQQQGATVTYLDQDVETDAMALKISENYNALRKSIRNKLLSCNGRWTT